MDINPQFEIYLELQPHFTNSNKSPNPGLWHFSSLLLPAQQALSSSSVHTTQLPILSSVPEIGRRLINSLRGNVNAASSIKIRSRRCDLVKEWRKRRTYILVPEEDPVPTFCVNRCENVRQIKIIRVQMRASSDRKQSHKQFRQIRSYFSSDASRCFAVVYYCTIFFGNLRSFLPQNIRLTKLIVCQSASENRSKIPARSSDMLTVIYCSFISRPCVIRSGTREVHNKLEKNRRAHLKECFELLKRQLPSQDEKKSSNLSILHAAIRYIQVCEVMLSPSRYHRVSTLAKVIKTQLGTISHIPMYTETLLRI